MKGEKKEQEIKRDSIPPSSRRELVPGLGIRSSMGN
jgi:hypothetical protein